MQNLLYDIIDRRYHRPNWGCDRAARFGPCPGVCFITDLFFSTSARAGLELTFTLFKSNY